MLLRRRTMDDKIRDPKYRVDLLKLKNKLFNQYPKGSLEYQRLIQQEKIKELITLQNTLVQYPKEETDKLLKETNDKIKQLTIMVGVSTLGIFYFGLSVIWLPALILKEIFGTVTVGCMSVFLYGAYQIYMLQKVQLNFLNAEKNVRSEIDKLQRDIDNGSRL